MSTRIDNRLKKLELTATPIRRQSSPEVRETLRRLDDEHLMALDSWHQRHKREGDKQPTEEELDAINETERIYQEVCAVMGPENTKLSRA